MYSYGKNGWKRLVFGFIRQPRKIKTKWIRCQAKQKSQCNKKEHPTQNVCLFSLRMCPENLGDVDVVVIVQLCQGKIAPFAMKVKQCV